MFRKVFNKKNARGKYAQYDDSPQAPILVSDASIEDLSLSVPNPKGSPRSPRCVRIQAPMKTERGEDSQGFEELFFNKEVGSKTSEVGKPCEECDQTLEVKKTCSCLLTKEPKQTAKSLPLCKIIQESGGASSFPDTECSSWDASARAHYYHHKLMSTLQVLANKEETVRVQAESLRVAEARIAALSARADKLRAQLEDRAHELRSLHLSTDTHKPERADVAVTADAQGDCTCGLEEENMRLKDINEKMHIQIGELRQRVSELEAALSDKENGEETRKNELAEKERELAEVKQQLAELQESAGDRSNTCEALAMQLRQAQVSIEDQTRELVEARRHEAALAHLTRELDQAKRLVEESRGLREEVSALRQQAADSGRRARALADQLARAHHARQALDACYRDKCNCATTLQAQLEEAHSRGAELCEEVKRVVCGVQVWVRRMRARHREQENKIKEQEAVINALQFQRNDAGLTELTNVECCTKCVSLTPKRSRVRVSETVSCECITEEHNRDERTPEVKERREDHRKNSRSEIDCECSSRMEQRQARRKSSASEIDSCVCSSRGERRYDRATTSRNETGTCECARVGERQDDRSKTSGSEVASCSSAPTPPRRLLRKKFNPCDEKSWWWVSRRDACVQQPRRRDAASAPAADACRRCPADRVRANRLPRDASPSAELEQRVSALHAALQRSQERWARHSAT